MMATGQKPQIIVEVVPRGVAASDAVADALKGVAEAQGDVAKATEDAAAAAKKSADAAAGAGSKWSSLVAKLKAGAGAAASASAGLAGVAATLNTDMTEGTKLAVAGLQGISGVLGAFGPIGQLAATGVSLVTAGIAALSGEAEKAYEPTYNLAEQYEKMGESASFAARSIGMMFSEVAKFAEVRKRIKEAGDLSVGIFGVPIEDVPTQWAAAAGAVQGSLTEARTAFAATQAELTTLQARRNGLDVSYYRAELERLEGLNEAARKNVQVRRDSLAAVVVAYKQTQAAFGPELPPGGLPVAKAASGPKGKSRAEIEHEAYLRVNALRLEATAAVEAGVAAIEADYAARKEAAAMASAERLTALYAARAQADREITRMAAEEQAAAAAATQAEWETTFAKLEDSAAGFGKEMANAAAASLLFGASFSEVAEQALEALAVQAGGEALMEGARAVAALASYLFTPWNASLLASAKTHALAAAGFAAIAGGAAIGANSIGSGGGGGASAATAGAGGPPQAFGNERPEEPRESMINLNLTAGQGGRPLSRADGQAILGALAGLVRGNEGGR